MGTRRRVSRRRLALAAIPVAVVALLAGMVGGVRPATAAPSQATVQEDDFPAVAVVARQYPQFRGGSITLYPTRRQPPDVPYGDCLGGTTSDVRVQSSRTAGYLLRDGQHAYFQGLADPTIAVYLYGKAAGAKRAMTQLREAFDQCWGTHGDRSYSVTYLQRPMPAIGAERFAFRKTIAQQGMGRDYNADTWVRNGRFLIATRVQLDPAPPRLRPLYNLTRSAVAAAGH